MRLKVVAVGVSVLTAVSSAASLRIADWNVANHPNNADDDAQLRTVLAYAGASKSIDLLTLAETDTGSVPQTAVDFAGVYGGTYASVVGPADGGGDRTGFVYNTATLKLVGTATIGATTLTHPTLRAEFRPVGTNGDADLFVYATHLMSGTSSTIKKTRVTEAATIRADAATLGSANVIVAGDFNWQKADDVSPGVGAYRTLSAPGIGQVVDPLNRVGDWHGNSAYQDLFTEAPNSNLDDRFDMQLTSGQLLNGLGLDHVAGSDRVVGNEGTVASGGVIAASATLPANVVDALDAFSDHLPVLADYTYTQGILFGDADSDGGVSINDFNALAANFGQTGKAWADGDFDRDGGVSINDFNLLAGDFGKSIGSTADGPNVAALAMWGFAVAHHDEAGFIAATAYQNRPSRVLPL